jgi:hypothetical protein
MLLLGPREGKASADRQNILTLVTGSHANLTPEALGLAALHPALQDQDGSHPVDGLASLFN